MNTVKIGKFIAIQRKAQNLTQTDLAEKLNITDRAVSKWERGISMPDSSIMLELCKLLDINVNELLTGEKINMENYNENAEKNLVELKKQKEASDKRLLQAEIWIVVFGMLCLFALIAVAAFTNLPDWAKVVMLVAGTIVFLSACMFALKIEQVAGYYECKYCHHRYVPTYKQVNLAMHMGRTRYMKCPKCGKKSWHKKVLSDSEE
ncbi:MAG: helix-turn-helix transcriptional regulator [Clostridia bacterium]|nr:helix-turn-helix transcriptional regulator [Clostridia bacterium]